MRDDKGKNDKNSDSSLVASPVQGHEYSPKNNENLSSREIVYEYIRKQMKEGNLLPGSVLDLKAISHKLGTSSTPLRDSIIRLEAEGYLTIYPRSKVVVNSLELEDFPFLYEIMGSLEYTVIASNMFCYTEEILSKMRGYNEKMKIAIGCVYPKEEETTMDVKGRCLLTGLPKVVAVSSTEMMDAFEEPVERIMEAIHSVLERTPPELVADISTNGIVMTGGGSLIDGFDKLITSRTGIATSVADNAIACVAEGTGKSLDMITDMQEGTINLSRTRQVN